MTKTQKAHYETFHRVSNFGKSNSEVFPASSTAGQAFAEVADAAARIDALLVAKPLAIRNGRTIKAEARAALHHAMRAIARTARGLPLIGYTNQLRLPDEHSDRQMIAAAGQFITTGEAVEEALVRLGLPATWLVDLRGAATRFTAAMEGGNTGDGRAANAQQGIVEAIARGVHALRRLDIVVPNALEGTPELLAEWHRGRGGSVRRSRPKVAVPAALSEPAAGEPQAEATTPAPVAEPAPASEATDDPLRRAS